MADFKITQTGVTIQNAIDRATISTVTKTMSTDEYYALENKDPKTLYILTDVIADGNLEARVSDLDDRITDVGTLLDEINGEVV